MGTVNEELMERVLKGEPFKDWGDYNRKYAIYVAEEYQKRGEHNKQDYCLHMNTKLLPSGRKKCINCGKIGG